VSGLHPRYEVRFQWLADFRRPSFREVRDTDLSSENRAFLTEMS
jgi:hypothetical protein